MGWISAYDRLPGSEDCVDVWGRVLGGNSNGDEARIENCFFDVVRDCFWKWDEFCKEKIIIEGFEVTHWMPLPEPPKEPKIMTDYDAEELADALFDAYHKNDSQSIDDVMDFVEATDRWPDLFDAMRKAYWVKGETQAEKRERVFKAYESFLADVCLRVAESEGEMK